jgi:desulfoferrodoxin (superoxide reductase-like protein)
MKMHNLIRTLFMAGALTASLHAQGVASDGKKPVIESYEDEISNYVQGTTFPQNFKGGIVMVRFTMDEQHHIKNVQVYTENEVLKTGISRSLTGKTVKHFIPVSYQQKNQDYYMLRLHITLS